VCRGVYKISGKGRDGLIREGGMGKRKGGRGGAPPEGGKEERLGDKRET